MNKIDKWIERIRGIRKWSVMIALIIVGIVFRVLGLLNGVEFVALLKDASIAFMASNAIEYARYFASDKLKTKTTKKQQQSED